MDSSLNERGVHLKYTGGCFGVRLDKLVLLLVGKLFQSLSFCLRNKQGREDTCEHEQGENLEDVVDKGVLSSVVLELEGKDLGHNGSQLARGGRDTVCSGTVAGGEELSRNDDCRV